MKAFSLMKKSRIEEARLPKTNNAYSDKHHDFLCKCRRKFQAEIIFHVIIDKLYISLKHRKFMYKNLFSLFNFLIESTSSYPIDEVSLKILLKIL